MKLVLIILSILNGLSTIGQPNLVWVKSIGGLSEQEGAEVAVDLSGNVFTIGSFRGTIDFDPGPGVKNLTPNGDFDVFITKFDAAGNLIWARNMGGLMRDTGQSIAIDSAGNVYTVGELGVSGDFDPGPGTYTLTGLGCEAFISKLDSMGNFIWAKSIGGPNTQSARSVRLDNAGNIYMMGFFEDTADFDPGPAVYNFSSNGSLDIYISKLTNTGDLIWAKQLGGVGTEYTGGIAVDKASNVYVIGSFPNTVDFDPGVSVYNLSSVGQSDIFISKIDSSGNFIWAVSMGSYNNESPGSIAVDDAENVYCTGSFSNNADFDPGTGTYFLTSTSWDEDIFVNKLDSSGGFVWAKNFGGMGPDGGYGIALDSSGNIYTTGHFNYIADFDPGPGVYNISCGTGWTSYLNKLDPSGSNLWAIPFSAFYCGSVTTDLAGNIYATGGLLDSADFDPGPSVFEVVTAGSFDVYVLKLNEATITGIGEKINRSGSVSIYPNPSGGQFNLKINDGSENSAKIELADLTGKLIFSITSEIGENNTSIDVSDLANGIYFLKVSNEKLNETLKLIINK